MSPDADKASTSMRRGSAHRPRKVDRRPLAIGAAIVLIAGFGYVVSMFPGRGVPARPAHAVMPFPGGVGPGAQSAEGEIAEVYEPLVDPAHDPAGHARQARQLEIRTRFQQAAIMLHAQRYDEAVTALHRLMVLEPRIPEAHVNMGFALLGKEQYKAAFDFFMTAIELNPAQANAYYGVALVQEAAGNLEGALGGMRAFLHLANNPDPTDLHVARARSAIWEWESKLGRGPWGPTGGIPPGFTEEQLKRDGQGVAIKMFKGSPAPGERVPYDIKSADRIEALRRGNEP